MIAIGLMSGTSLDGIDAVRIAVHPRAHGYEVETQAFVTLPFETDLRRRILASYPPAPLDALALSALHADIGEAGGGIGKCWQFKSHVGLLFGFISAL